MRKIKLEDIVIPPNRQRREFDAKALNDLAESIREKGLLHPLVLRENGVLVAGERRMRAIADLFALGSVFKHDEQIFAREVPYVLLGDLTPLEAEEAEYEENIQRTDLSWGEKCLATARLADLRRAQAISRNENVPSTAAIALEVRGSSKGANQEATRQELIVAKHLADPEIAGQKSTADAFKILKKREEAAKNRELAAEVGKTFTAELHQAHNVDCLTWLLEQPDERFDVILTDPPYGMGADTFGDSGNMAMQAHGYEDSEEVFKDIMFSFIPESFRLAKTQAHLYIFCDLDKFHFLRAGFETAGWQVHRTPLVWHKPNGSRAPWPDMGPHRKYELILYAVKGKRKTNYLAPDVITFPNESGAKHGAQKPVDLYIELLKRSAQPGNAVLDCFSGSGTIFPAAHAVKCKATGVERDPAYYALGLKRLELLKAQPDLAGLV